MVRTISTAAASEPAQHTPGIGRRLAVVVKITASLLAVYAPIALVLASHRMPIAKAYFALGMWAIEGILWYVLDNAIHPDRR